MSNKDHLPGTNDSATNAPNRRVGHRDIADVADQTDTANTLLGGPDTLSGGASYLAVDSISPEEAEVDEILARIERELPALEERANRLMYHYGLQPHVALNLLKWLEAARTMDRLWTLEAKHMALIEAQAKEIQSLKDRVTRLEAREEVLIAEARGAAATAASVAASHHVADLARRVGALDERTRRLPSQD